MNKLESIFNHRGFIYLALLILSVAVLFQSPHAPGALSMIENDNSNFITVAQNVLRGDVLFKDIADHKGPMVFVMNAWGLLLGNGNLTGIWILEILSLFVACLFTFKTASLFGSKLIALTTTILSIIFIVPILYGGNLTEEWVLPYLCVALYIIVRYLSGHSQRLSVFQLFLLACTGTLAFLFKASYIGIWAAYGCISAIKLFRERKIKELMFAGGMMLLFAGITLLPFWIYFYVHDALYDAYHWVIGFNLEYSFHYGTWDSILKRTLSILIGARHLPILVVLTFLLQVITKDYQKNKDLFYGTLLAFALTAYSCAIGMQLEHYNIIFAPLLVLPYTYLANRLNLHSFIQQFTFFILMTGSGYLFLTKLMDSRNYNGYFAEDAIKYKKIANRIQQHTTPHDTIIGTNEVKRCIYVYADRKCGNKSLGNNYFYHIHEEILTKRPHVFFTTSQFGFEAHREFYEIVDRCEEYYIWKRIDKK